MYIYAHTHHSHFGSRLAQVSGHFGARVEQCWHREARLKPYAPTIDGMPEDRIETTGMSEAKLTINVQTAGSRQCDISADERWTCHDLHKKVQEKLDVPVARQRLIYRSAVLEDFMAARGLRTLGQLHRLEGAHEVPLVLFLYIRSAEAVEALEAVKANGYSLLQAIYREDEPLHANKKRLYAAREVLIGDREVVMEAVRRAGGAI